MTPSSSDRAAEESYDVVVIGGGPGGSTAATLVAMDGHRVLLLEKEMFPRFQIGESLLPVTIHGVCRLLGALPEIEKASFMPKRGGTFRWGASPEPWNFLFAYSPMLRGETSEAYQVERMKFDEILLRNASRQGVHVQEGVSVTGVIEEDGRVAGVRYTGADGAARTVRAAYVVDASGSRSSLYRAVGERHYSSFFQNLALFGYFEGGGRLPGPDRGNILCCAFDEGWFWYIPLSDTLTSVGAVVRREYAGGIQNDPEAAFRRFIDRCPMVRDLLKDAPRSRHEVYGRLRVRKDYSYSMSRFWRPGMVLVGDAACFIDPVFSTGVHLATYSGLLAARSINSYLAGDLDEDRSFAEFNDRYRREYRVFYEFLAAFYDMQADTGSYYWQAKKVSGMEGGELEAFASLVGGTTAEAGLLLNGASSQLVEAVARTGPAQTESGERMGALFGAPVVAEVMREMNQIQAGVLGNPHKQPPLLPSDLVPSPDHLRWAESAVVAARPAATVGSKEG
ncbi:tryptophan 7-halogenase [Sphaerisporangium dianthi]|uniref:Tryptophan 7-halogenase n=1 Tax=Sphaerisporangium dianthi TaxID=1436120 RepID=A0ABV9CV61_9ACTN